jgi:diketogulonate reductase-like aldo/keto reductase
VVLAWHLAQGVCTIPKSSDSQRLRQNLAAQDIVLATADLDAIRVMDGTERDVTHPNTFGH